MTLSPEEQVRRRWETVSVFRMYGGAVNAEPLFSVCMAGDYYGSGNTEAEAMSAASAFTLQHAERIREVEEEIAEIKDDIAGYSNLPADPDLVVIYHRILARLKAIRAGLKRGWKD